MMSEKIITAIRLCGEIDNDGGGGGYYGSEDDEGERNNEEVQDGREVLSEENVPFERMNWNLDAIALDQDNASDS